MKQLIDLCPVLTYSACSSCAVVTRLSGARRRVVQADKLAAFTLNGLVYASWRRTRHRCTHDGEAVLTVTCLTRVLLVWDELGPIWDNVSLSIMTVQLITTGLT